MSYDLLFNLGLNTSRETNIVLLKIFNILHLMSFNQFISRCFPCHCKFNIGTFMTHLQLFYWNLYN